MLEKWGVVLHERWRDKQQENHNSWVVKCDGFDKKQYKLGKSIIGEKQTFELRWIEHREGARHRNRWHIFIFIYLFIYDDVWLWREFD